MIPRIRPILRGQVFISADQLTTVKREIFAAFLVRIFGIRTGLRGFNFAIAEFATVAFMLHLPWISFSRCLNFAISTRS